MGGRSFGYKLYTHYYVEIFEFYEDTSITRVFIYKNHSFQKDLVEIMDFPEHTDKVKILEKAEEFIKNLENIISGSSGVEVEKIKVVKEKSLENKNNN